MRNIGLETFAEMFEEWKGKEENKHFLASHQTSNLVDNAVSHWSTDPILMKPLNLDIILKIFGNLYSDDSIPEYTGRVVETDLIVCKNWITENPHNEEGHKRLQPFIDKMESFVAKRK